MRNSRVYADINLSAVLHNLEEMHKNIKEDTQIVNKHWERFSISLAIREMEIKTSVRSLESLGCLDRNSWQGCIGTGTLIHC